ncbi:abscisic acid 8'-hydroxylase 2 [Aristolochia californica]|uniref:abscisic acid 8'-hydroxylase 2 n=1 Tax=Aristolochia californica TaxID=171875 RepID=UPI0035DC4C7E
MALIMKKRTSKERIPMAGEQPSKPPEAGTEEVAAMPPLFLFHLFLLLLLAYSFHLMVKMMSRVRSSRAGEPPGSRGFPLIGETLSFLAANNSSKGFYDFVRIRRLRYGNCFKTNIFGKTHVFVSNRGAAKAVLGSDFQNFTKTYMRSIAEAVGSKSLLCTPQPDHSLIRGRLSDLFTTESMSSVIQQFDQLTLNALLLWESKQTVLVLNDALKITFMAICKMVMNLEDPDRLEMLQKDVSQITDAMLAFPLKLPWTTFYKGLKARRRFMDTVKEMIDSRRKLLDGNQEDFLQSLITDKGSSRKSALTDTQILDNILTLIIAGQVTTASAITWMIKYLDENQDAQDKLRVLQLSLAKRVSGSSLTLENLNEMTYASKVVKESLRMASVVPWFPRVALKDCEIEGILIRKGWIVNVDARAVHYDSSTYDNPSDFTPSRFDEDCMPYSFLAFGTGGRTCLGMNLAKAMMIVFLHRLVTTYRWKVIDSDSSLEHRALFPRLKNGCPVRVWRIPTD